MSIHRTYRGLVVVVALFVLLGLADRAFSYRLTNFATDVVVDVVAELVELATPSTSKAKSAIASAAPTQKAPHFEFPSVAGSGAFGGFVYGDQPSIPLGSSPVLDPGAWAAAGTEGTASKARVPGSGAGRRGAATGGGFGSGGASSGAGGPRLTSSAGAAEGSQAEAGAATSTADLAATPATGLHQASSLAERWSEAVAEQWSAVAGSGEPGSSEGFSTDPSQYSTDSVEVAGGNGALGEAQDGTISPGSSIAAGSLSEALSLDSANGGPRLDTPGMLDVSAVLDVSTALDVPGGTPSDLGLEALRQFRSEAVLNPGSAASGRPSPSAANDVSLVVLPEPAMLGMLGVGLLVLGARIRSRSKRA